MADQRQRLLALSSKELGSKADRSGSDGRWIRPISSAGASRGSGRDCRAGCLRPDLGTSSRVCVLVPRSLPDPHNHPALCDQQHRPLFLRAHLAGDRTQDQALAGRVGGHRGLWCHHRRRHLLGLLQHLPHRLLAVHDHLDRPLGGDLPGRLLLADAAPTTSRSLLDTRAGVYWRTAGWRTSPA